MTDYVKSTDFAAKDALASGNAGKIVKGTEIDTEFNNIATAVATKANTSGPTFTGTTTLATANVTTLIATTATLTSATISGGSVSGITDIAVADGGTGASTAADARANLGTVADTAANGIAARTAANTLTARTITAGSGITVTDGDGVSGNPTIANSGVLSIKGQSSDTAATGAVTLTSLSSFANSISSNGYQKLPGGLIIQWGSFTSNTDDTQTISFPLTFPTACYAVTSTISGIIGISSTSQFTVNRIDAYYAGSSTGYFIAIGS